MLPRTQGRQPGAFELLPAIDLRGGRVVRLAEGDFARETIYGTDPAEVALGFAAAGANWIHIVDLDGARDGTRRQIGAVARIVDVVGERVACEVAGGLRDETAVESVFAAGAARAVVGTAALRDPDLVARLIARFGADRIAVAVEAALAALSARGARTFIVTAIERDGLMSGPNLELLRRMVGLGLGEIIASAGVSSLDDIAAVRAAGCVGAVVGRAIYERRLDLASAIRTISANRAG